MLGKTVKDKVTGFQGVATAKVEYINGCVQYCVKPKMTEEGKMPDGEYIDVQQLEMVANEPVAVEPSTTGGPQRDCPPT